MSQEATINKGHWRLDVSANHDKRITGHISSLFLPMVGW